MTEKMSTTTPDIERENAEKLAELFPSVVIEVAGEDGIVHAAIDADALRELVGDVAEGQRERYQFTWPGKRQAKAEAYTPIDQTCGPSPGGPWAGTRPATSTSRETIWMPSSSCVPPTPARSSSSTSTRPTTRATTSSTTTSRVPGPTTTRRVAGWWRTPPPTAVSIPTGAR